MAAILLVLVANSVIGSPISNKAAGSLVALLGVALISVWKVPWTEVLGPGGEELPLRNSDCQKPPTLAR